VLFPSPSRVWQLTPLSDVLSIDLSTAQHKFKAPLDRLDEPSRLNHLLAAMSAVLRRALNTRAKLVVLSRSTPAAASTTWPLGTARPSAIEDAQVVELGLTLDQAECWRLVDAGPSAEDEAGSEDFRQFWGDRSELRRFKDGRIIESVVWDIGATEGERSLIVGRSVRYILDRHFGLGAEAITTESLAGYLPLVQLPASARDLLAVEGAPADGFRPALEAYTSLVTTLRSLEDKLPLSLLNVFPVAQALRYTSIFSPLATDPDRLGLAPDCLKFVAPLDIVVQFESSGKWPDDLAAIQKIKLAFFHKMATLLAGAIEGAQVAVAVDDCDDVDEAVIRDNCSLEVFHPAGFAFRLRIHHDRERTLLQQLVGDKKNTKPRTRRAAQKALDLHQHRFAALPRHHAAINSLHHLYPSFSLTARLVQRWLSAHMLEAHVSAELVELLCAAVYLVPTPHSPPASHAAGFARVIALLARWKWATSPLVLPLYSTAGADAGVKVAFPADKRERALAAFKKLRETDVRITSGAFFVATEEDLTGRVFGAAQPGRLVAARIGQIAKATLACLEKNGHDGSLIVEVRLQPRPPVLAACAPHPI
jgi:U3 small nucleolar RNA-associated protein 22